MKAGPEQVTDYFFKSLMHNQCHVCWGLFTRKTQKKFLQWAKEDIYSRHPEAAAAAKLGDKEIKLLFENNDASLMKTFWKKFFYESHANDFFRYGYYKTIETRGLKAQVQVTFQYPTGETNQVTLTMMKEGAAWKFAYLESGLPFNFSVMSGG